MSLFEEIVKIYPELSDGKLFDDCTIMLQDDCDGKGVFIAKWDYEKEIPKNLKLGK